MTVNLLKEGSSNLDTPQPFPLCLPPQKNNVQKTGQRRGGRGKETILDKRGRADQGASSANVCKQPSPDILKSDLNSIGLPASEEGGRNWQTCGGAHIQALSYTLKFINSITEVYI